LLPEWMLPVAAVLMGLGALGGESGLHAALLISTAGWIIIELVFTPKKELSKFTPLGFGLFGMVWIIWSLAHMTLIKELPDGTALLFFLLFVISFSDIFAYFGGKRFGKSMLAPTISPKKTWEGSFFGVVGGGIVGAVFGEITMSMFWLYGMLLAMGIFELVGLWSLLVILPTVFYQSVLGGSMAPVAAAPDWLREIGEVIPFDSIGAAYRGVMYDAGGGLPFIWLLSAALIGIILIWGSAIVKGR